MGDLARFLVELSVSLEAGGLRGLLGEFWTGRSFRAGRPFFALAVVDLGVASARWNDETLMGVCVCVCAWVISKI